MSDDYEEDDIDVQWAGFLFDKRYILIKRLGYGAFASVWLTYDYDTDDYYAIKIHNRSDYDAGTKEARVLQHFATLKNPNLMSYIRVFDYVMEASECDSENTEDNNHLCIVMELMTCTVLDLIKSFKDGLPPEKVLYIVKQIENALRTLHSEGYIHTDLKPENILVKSLKSTKYKELIDELNKKINVIKNKHTTDKKKKNKKKEGNRDKIIEDICDLVMKSTGSSSYYSDSEDNIDDLISKLSIDSNTSTNSVDTNKDCVIDLDSDFHIKLADMGTCVEPECRRSKSIQTRYYRSPEVILKLDYSNKCDIWSFGCTIYELLTGHILFDPDKNPKRVNDDREHLHLIMSSLGLIPPDMIAQSELRDYVFNSNEVTIRGYTEIVYKSLLDKIYEKHDKENEIITELVKMIYEMLAIDPNRRYQLI
jgi:serine/threonine-protein kinase SRPK3